MLHQTEHESSCNILRGGVGHNKGRSKYNAPTISGKETKKWLKMNKPTETEFRKSSNLTPLFRWLIWRPETMKEQRTGTLADLKLEIIRNTFTIVFQPADVSVS